MAPRLVTLAQARRFEVPLVVCLSPWPWPGGSERPVFQDRDGQSIGPIQGPVDDGNPCELIVCTKDPEPSVFLVAWQIGEVWHQLAKHLGLYFNRVSPLKCAPFCKSCQVAGEKQLGYNSCCCRVGRMDENRIRRTRAAKQGAF